MKRLLSSLIIAFILSSAKLASACSVCFFGDPTEKANIALRNGILALLVVLLGVLTLFIKFFLGIAKRSKFQRIEN